MSNSHPNPINSSSTSNTEIQQTTLTVTDTEQVINLSGQLNPSDLITSIPISQKQAQEILTELTKQATKSTEQRETTRGKLAMFLAKIFGSTLAASYLLMTVAVLKPNTDTSAIKDLISQTITPQVTLLSFALGFYFGSNKEKDK